MYEDKYTVLPLKGRSLEKMLNIYARQGYEFIQAINVNGDISLIFKRP